MYTKRGYSERWGYSEGSNTFKNPQAYELYLYYSELRSLSSFRNNYLNNTELPTVRNRPTLPYNSIPS